MKRAKKQRRQAPPANASNAPTSAAQSMIDLAISHHGAGDFDEADRLYREALALEPSNHLAMALLGTSALQTGRTDTALELLLQAIEIFDQDSLYHVNAALALESLGRAEESKASAKRALELEPNNPEALNLTGKLYIDAGLDKEAYQVLSRATRHHPDYAEAWINLTGVLHRMGREKDAMTAARKGVHRGPDHPMAHYNLGQILIRGGEYEAAIPAFEKSVEPAPGFADPWANIATAYVALFRPDDAETAARRALEIDPDNATANANLGLSMMRRGRYPEAIDPFERALSVDPLEPAALSNLGCLYLAEGDLLHGWPLFEQMLEHGTRSDKVIVDAAEIPLWRGESLADKSVLISGEQGIGEQVLFSSFVREIEDQGPSEIVFACEPRLAPLVERSMPGVRVLAVEAGTPVPGEYDYFAPVGSLAPVLRPNLDSLKPAKPYLIADPDLVGRLRQRYARDVRRDADDLVVGISWRSASPVMGLEKNVPLERWVPVFAAPNTRFVSIQYGDVAQEVESARSELGVDIHVDQDVDALRSIEQNAAQIAACDAIVTISNAGLHLAGALGAETVALIGRDPNWYWGRGLGSDRSGWYSSVKICRQDIDGDWTEAVESASALIRR